MKMKSLLKKWHLLALTLVLLVTALGIAATPVAADAPPGNFIKVTSYPGGSNNYFDLTIYDGSHNPLYSYPGWCVDTNNHISVGAEYSVVMLDYFGNYYPTAVNSLPNPPKERIKAINWNAVAYVINHPTPGASYAQIQTAIWYFTREPNYPLGAIDTVAQGMINAAIANPGYIPGTNDLRPIICYIASSSYDPVNDVNGVQLIFFQYKLPPYTPPVPEMPAGILLGFGLVGLAGFGWYGYRKSQAIRA